MTECLCPGNEVDECPCSYDCACWDEDDEEYDGPPPRPITTVPTGSYL